MHGVDISRCELALVAWSLTSAHSARERARLADILEVGLAVLWSSRRATARAATGRCMARKTVRLRRAFRSRAGAAMPPALFRQGAEGDREAQRVAGERCYAPNRAALRRTANRRSAARAEIGAPEAGSRSVGGSAGRPACRARCRRRLRTRPVAVPADAGARIVAGEQDVDEIPGSQAREPRPRVAQRRAANPGSAPPA